MLPATVKRMVVEKKRLLIAMINYITLNTHFKCVILVKVVIDTGETLDLSIVFNIYSPTNYKLQCTYFKYVVLVVRVHCNKSITQESKFVVFL